MSDTPETDAAVDASDGQWSFVLKQTCKRLERERDEARRLVAFAQDAFNVIHVEVGGWISATIEGGDK